MPIRWKLLILLLTIALAPLALVAWLDVRSTRGLGRDFAQSTRAALAESATRQLRQLTGDYARLIEARRASVEFALRLAVREVEAAMAEGRPLGAAASIFDLIAAEHAGLVDRQRVVLLDGRLFERPERAGADPEEDARDGQAVLDALMAGDLVWSAPRSRAGGVSLTASAPVRDAGRVLVGAVCIDLRVDALIDLIDIPAPWRSGTTIALVTPAPQGAAEDGDGDGLEVLLQRTTGTDPTEDTGERGALDAPAGEARDALLADVRSGRPGTQRMALRGQPSIWAYGPAGDRGLFALIIVPQSLVVGEALAAEAAFLARTARQLAVAGAVLFVALLIVVVASVAASRSITRPIRALAEAARRIAEGDLDARVKVTSGDELEGLARAFNAMAPKLRDRVRLRESLALAMEVQQSLLPSRPTSPPGFELAGRSVYCDETGGDYYDFIDLEELEPGLVGVAVGDVSGHGVSAALLMTTARAILRAHAASHAGLGTLVSELNRQLSADTMRGRFMTLFVAVFGGEGGAFRYVSAGHDPAIVYDPARDEFAELLSDDIPLGIRREWRYEEHRREDGAQGEIILIGTDGLWDTRNVHGEHFGKDRLRRALRENAARSAEQIAEAVIDAVDDFRGREAQRDDLTLVVIKTPAVAAARPQGPLAAAS